MSVETVLAMLNVKTDRVVLVDALPRYGCYLSEWISVNKMGCDIPSPRTALKRLTAKKATLTPNFILKVIRQGS